jgi:AcrR family transcriptional regulator
MAELGNPARANQKRRARKDLLQAASRLMKQGRKPSIDEIAEEALVSRATAYRYFPGLEALLVEASLDVSVPSPQELFERASSTDPVARVQSVDTALHDVIGGNEAPFRMMLIHALERGLERKDGDELPIRQNRRTALIETALEPLRGELTPQAFETLSRALALIIGTEGMIVVRDVLQLEDATARKVKQWAIAALIEAARTPGSADRMPVKGRRSRS